MLPGHKVQKQTLVVAATVNSKFDDVRTCFITMTHTVNPTMTHTMREIPHLSHHYDSYYESDSYYEKDTPSFYLQHLHLHLLSATSRKGYANCLYTPEYILIYIYLLQ